MPLAGDTGAGGTGGRRKKPAPQPLQVFNPATNSTTTLTGTQGSSGSEGSGTKSPVLGAKGTSSSSSSKSSSSSASSSYEAAQRKRDTAARDRYVEDAENMQGQVEALNKALGIGKGKGTFRKALTDRLANIKLVRDQQVGIVEDGYLDRLASLGEDAENNERAASDSSMLNMTNASRERMSALSEVFAQGGGESDMLRVQLHSLRNADANQDGINRAFYDGQRSINASRMDLSTDTRTGIANVYSEANADKQQMWDNFYNQVSESQTQLGNTLGQQAEYYGLAAEANANAGGKGGKLTSKSSSKSSSKESSKESSKSKSLGKGRTAQVVGGTRGDFIDPKDQPLLQQDRPFNARPQLDGVGGPDGGRPAAGKRNVPRDWDKPGKTLGPRAGRGRPKKGTQSSGTIRDRQDAAAKASDKAFMEATKATRKVWENPGLPNSVLNWQNPASDNTVLANTIYDPTAQGTVQPKAPEGATLRKW